jgi:large subunit ribosomal protein L18
MKAIKNKKRESRTRRHGRIRTQAVGTAARPRLSVFRSNKFIYAQIIDDASGVTLAAASDVKEAKGKKVERAKTVGTELAKKAKAQKIESVVFDRGGFLYAGRVKALAEGAREGGLTF